MALPSGVCSVFMISSIQDMRIILLHTERQNQTQIIA